MALRRGFKTEANKISKDLRRELELAPEAPLNPWKLAENLGIPIWTLSEMKSLAPNAVNHFTLINTSEFSATTVFNGNARTIVHNDAHSLGRQSNNIFHEIAHGLLLHPPQLALDARGCRNWNNDYEEEAKFLSAALLVSDEAAIHIARNNISVADAAVKYGASEKVINWRLRITGAFTRVARTRNYYSNMRRN
ncbi:MAG: ImmA/IrrE family metallo-endopeptidase [Pyrinomonadaceae bacterium]